MNIKGYKLELTCSACPEQYEVFKDGKQVAYMRLRHGVFRVDVPDCNGETIYTAGPKGDGSFDDDERDYYLNEAIWLIDNYYNPGLQAHFFECVCHSDEHTLKFIFDPEDKEMYTTVYLGTKPLFERLWVALKYAFGYTCKYGHWDCFLLKDTDINKLISILNKCRKEI